MIVPQPPTESVPEQSAERAQSWSAVSRRIARRTTDFLAVCLIGFALISVGDRVLGWWKRTDSSRAPGTGPAVSAPLDWSAAESPIAMTWGSGNQLIWRQEIKSDPDNVRDDIVQICLARAQDSPWPEQTIQESEIQFLADLEQRSPERKSGSLAIHLIAYPQLMAVAVRCRDPGSGSEITSRITCWCIALPWVESRWLVIGFHPTRSDDRSSPVPWELPQGSRITMSLASSSTGRFAAIEGSRLNAGMAEVLGQPIGDKRSGNELA